MPEANVVRRGVTRILPGASARAARRTRAKAPLSGFDVVGVTVEGTPATVAAVKQMRKLVASGLLKKVYEAAIGLSTPEAKEEALKLFNALPKISQGTTADDFVALGLWSTKPKGLKELESAARYLPGRQLLVEAPIDSDVLGPK